MLNLTLRHTQLIDRLAALYARLQEIEDELDSPHSKDWEELATEREGDEVLERLGLSGQDEIARIRAALARMDAGDYGFCTQCGARISDARLDLLPSTPYCSRCAT